LAHGGCVLWGRARVEIVFVLTEYEQYLLKLAGFSGFLDERSRYNPNSIHDLSTIKTGSGSVRPRFAQDLFIAPIE
jgi:hypothetical protein